MNAPSFDIASYIEDYVSFSSSGVKVDDDVIKVDDDVITVGDGTGLTYKTDLFIGREPAKPVDCVTVFDTPGFGDDLGLTTQGYERPSIQIRVRNKGYQAGWVIAQNIKNLLHGLEHQTINGTLYTVIYCTGSPTLLDYDDNGNVRWILNMNIQRRS